MLFFSHSLGYSDPDATAIYSYFTSFAYFTPLLGGYLADSYLGKYKVCNFQIISYFSESHDGVLWRSGVCVCCKSTFRVLFVYALYL